MNDLLIAYKVAIEAELALVEADVKKAHEKGDNKTVELILSYVKGLQRSYNIFAEINKSVVL